MRIRALSIAAMASIGASAALITPQQALDRAIGSQANLLSTSKVGQLELVYTSVAVSDNQPGCYVFEQPDKGFVVVAADDVAQPLLAFSESGSFLYDGKIPDNVAWWLSQYDAEIAAARSAGATKQIGFKEKTRPNIAPLVKTKWNQDHPYNYFCPSDAGGKSVTGCVATAMAQVMRYFSWPAKGEGSHAYNWWNGSKYEVIELDFSKINYKWSSMLDEYTGSYNSLRRDAVANLMFSCGVSVDMNYSSYASGAYSENVPVALSSYFDYNRGAHILYRSYFSLDEWKDVVYGQLAASRPVYYSGTGTEGGHAFVCDGYDSGFFHFNWGWGGVSDGYFALNALNPPAIGIGGFEGGFNLEQSIMVDAFPANEPDATPGYVVFYGYQFGLDMNSLDDGVFNAYFTVDSEQNIQIYSTNYGLKFTDDNGFTAYSAFASSNGNNHYGISAPADLPDGEYKVSPVAQVNDSHDWLDVHCLINYTRYGFVTVKNGKVVSLRNFTSQPLEVKVKKAPADLIFGNDFEIKLQVTNPNTEEVFDKLYAVIINDESYIIWEYESTVDLEGGETSDVTMSGVFSAPQISEPGNYDIYICQIINGSYNVLTDPISVNIKYDTTGKPVLGVSSFYCESTGSLLNIPSEDFTILAEVVCQRSIFTGKIYMKLYDWSWNYLAAFASEELTINTGQKVVAHINGSFPAASPDSYYIVVLSDGTNDISEYLAASFTTGTGAYQLTCNGAWLTGDFPTTTDPVIKIMFEVTNNGAADYCDVFILQLLDANKTPILEQTQEDVLVPAADSADVEFNLEIPDPVVGDYYLALFYVKPNGDFAGWGYWQIPCEEGAGVEGINADSADSTVLYYNLQGAQARPDERGAGLYLKVSRDSQGNVRTEKVLVR